MLFEKMSPNFNLPLHLISSRLFLCYKRQGMKVDLTPRVHWCEIGRIMHIYLMNVWSHPPFSLMVYLIKAGVALLLLLLLLDARVAELVVFWVCACLLASLRLSEGVSLARSALRLLHCECKSSPLMLSAEVEASGAFERTAACSWRLVSAAVIRPADIVSFFSEFSHNDSDFCLWL